MKKENYITLTEASKYCPYSQEYLSLRARQGKLKSVKFGKIWMTKREWLKDYLEKTEEYKNKIQKKLPFFKRIKIKKIFPIVLIILTMATLTVTYFFKKELLTFAYQNLLASLQELRMRFAQVSPTLVERPIERKETLQPEPYLTINAETDINAPLNVKDIISAPNYAIRKGEFKATITSLGLTADRTYEFPDLSGVVCLTAGNCFGIFGEVRTPGGITNRVAKFITAREIGVSSINDLFTPGISITIDSAGNVGIGTERPRAKLEVAGKLITTENVGIKMERPLYPLHVRGKIQATGDICTDLGGGKCLSQLERPFPPGIMGVGTINYIPIWTGGMRLGNSIISQADSRINIAGTIEILGFKMPSGAAAGYILTSDASGVGTWQPAPTGALPTGQLGFTLRHDGTNWIADPFLYNTGNTIGIGTTSTPATLTLSGNAIFSTTTLPQLRLAFDGDSYLDFEISDNQTLIEASHNLVINSLTGEIFFANNVSNFYATSTTIRGLTFISSDSTVRKSGEYVFRSAIPIFRFPIAAQTTSTGWVVVSKQFLPTDSLNAILPPQLPGTQRKYAFLINFADDIPTTSSSSWRVFRPSAATTTVSFQLQGQGLTSLDVGNPFSTDYYLLPDNDWQLEVQLPSTGNRIRIFNILLLVFDQL